MTNNHIVHVNQSNYLMPAVVYLGARLVCFSMKKWSELCDDVCVYVCVCVCACVYVCCAHVCLRMCVCSSVVPRLDSLSLGARLETCHMVPLRVHYTEN